MLIQGTTNPFYDRRNFNYFAADGTYTADDNNHDPTNANATPPYANIVGWGTEWPCKSWTIWHTTLKTAFGKDQADSIWLDAWNKQHLMSSDLSWCKYDSDFNDYVTAEKLGVSWILPDIIAGGTKVVRNVAGTAADTSKAADNLAKVLKVAVPVAGVLLLVGLAWWSYNKFIKA